MAEPRQGSYKILVQSYEDALDTLLEQGVYKPVFLYHIVIFNILPLIGLVIPRRGATRYVRPGIFALSLGIAVEVLSRRRAFLGGNGYMIGLMTAWWLLWSAVLFVFSDIENDFRRIERGDLAGESICDDAAGGGASQSKSLDRKGNPVISSSTISPIPNRQAIRTACADNHGLEKFHWQTYPRKLTHRFEWCAGLLFNLRGPEWNWRAPHLGPLPRSVHTQLHAGFQGDRFKAHDDATYTTAKNRLRAALWKFLQGYLLLDCLKVVMMRDPYFRGIFTNEMPPPFPFSYVASIPLFIRFYHCFISCMGVYVALEFVTSLNPICFLGLSMAFSNAARKLTGAPLDASWLYADSFGPFITSVLDHGLAGCWGRWWHQLFRQGFTATAHWILSLLPTRWSADTRVKRITHVLVAFAISGFIHASGSHTQFANTYPLSGPFLFFSLQGLAIMLENIFKTVIFPRLPLADTPRWVRRTANAVFVFCWLFYSGAFIADDFARGGLWLMEPVPISPIRGLGLAYDKGWWCWDKPWFHYWSDGTYWGSGIRVI
ncbi:uncharacterized protein N7496_003711 [Penicillium cataractarum]|uniref:Wax synthase domain-containing protein n=1 Tax=Penicillium cataractarum TaxID=2100454 RepID=A0A9W9SRS4_9EURO|nr:uncharacterized protein N7496_003711 [Penicillium cataractarum]KAJ5381283.1 hypothetical protein N7496_003711 [Penicillium cataractarum]